MDIRSLLRGEGEPSNNSYISYPQKKPDLPEISKVEPVKKPNPKEEESEEDSEEDESDDDDSEEQEGTDAVLYYNIVTTRRGPGKRKIKPRDFVVETNQDRESDKEFSEPSDESDAAIDSGEED
jgi:hypothetical protein